MCVLYCDLNLVDLREALSDPPAASASPWGLLPAASLPGQLRGSKPAVPASRACIAGLQRDCRAWGSLPYVPCILAALRACNRLGIVRASCGTTWGLLGMPMHPYRMCCGCSLRSRRSAAQRARHRWQAGTVERPLFVLSCTVCPVCPAVHAYAVLSSATHSCTVYPLYVMSTVSSLYAVLLGYC